MPKTFSIALPQLRPAVVACCAMAGPDSPLLAPEEHVLSTLNRDGSRHWLTPRLSKGRWWKRRLIVAWSLILLFALLPWIRIGGMPPILLDVVARQFTFFGTTFRPTDTLLLAFLILSIFVGIFLLTAIFGRVWCGWACPQTVYLEFVYRPVERFFLGPAYGNGKLRAPAWRIAAMYVVFFLVSAHLANTFLAYFVGTDRLMEWTFGSPFAHPTAFIVFGLTTGLMLFDFCFFREQMCTIACPYGRFQSVLLDRDSLIVGYDERRGEPRGKLRKGDDAGARGDCIDCTMCVQVCPTGIDIRQGLQMECIHCTQCVDACDSIMDKIGKPQGLIRYSSQNRLERVAGKRFRFRLAVYPLLLGALLTGFVYTLVTRQDAMVVQLQAQGTPYTVQEDGTVLNTVRLRVDNRTREPRTYAIEAGQGTTLREAVPPFTVDPTTSAEVAVHVLSPHASFAGGRRDITLRVLDGKTYDVTHSFPIIGPLGSFTRSAD